jgi:hypothetical protein
MSSPGLINMSSPGLINMSSPGLTGGAIRKTLKNGFPLEFTLEKSGAGMTKPQHALRYK